MSTRYTERYVRIEIQTIEIKNVIGNNRLVGFGKVILNRSITGNMMIFIVLEELIHELSRKSPSSVIIE